MGRRVHRLAQPLLHVFLAVGVSLTAREADGRLVRADEAGRSLGRTTGRSTAGLAGLAGLRSHRGASGDVRGVGRILGDLDPETTEVLVEEVLGLGGLRLEDVRNTSRRLGHEPADPTLRLVEDRSDLAGGRLHEVPHAAGRVLLGLGGLQDVRHAAGTLGHEATNAALGLVEDLGNLPGSLLHEVTDAAGRHLVQPLEVRLGELLGRAASGSRRSRGVGLQRVLGGRLRLSGALLLGSRHRNDVLRGCLTLVVRNLARGGCLRDLESTRTLTGLLLGLGDVRGRSRRGGLLLELVTDVVQRVGDLQDVVGRDRRRLALLFLLLGILVLVGLGLLGCFLGEFRSREGPRLSGLEHPLQRHRVAGCVVHGRSVLRLESFLFGGPCIRRRGCD